MKTSQRTARTIDPAAPSSTQQQPGPGGRVFYCLALDYPDPIPMGRSSPDPDPALAVGDDLKSAADHPSSDNSPQAHPGPHPPNSADGTYTAYSTLICTVNMQILKYLTNLVKYDLMPMGESSLLI
jgi:hypothetical protein